MTNDMHKRKACLEVIFTEAVAIGTNNNQGDIQEFQKGNIL